jgi:hypothetical protein
MTKRRSVSMVIFAFFMAPQIDSRGAARNCSATAPSNDSIFMGCRRHDSRRTPGADLQ